MPALRTCGGLPFFQDEVLQIIQAARSARRRELRGQINQRIAVVVRHLPDLASTKPAPAPEPADEPRKRPKLRTYLECDR
ncbi:hypothetical protein [Pseudarthrobacter sp. N5]|uniref:hypothetical protein n=1 Tax=Pseudarthrobacter sp. N5 TaxID=3418416 RepID=UPI003CEABB30